MGEYGENIGKMLQKLDPVSSICSRGTGGAKEKGISFFLHVPGVMFFLFSRGIGPCEKL